MAEIKIQVTENMAEFIEWAQSKGEDEIRRMIREYLAELKEQSEISKKSRVNEGFKWDKALEPNDNNDQWKHGGDCNLCRKASYCLTKCRANKLLKKLTTPFLYQKYLDDNPEAAAKQMTNTDPESLMKQLGVLQ